MGVGMDASLFEAAKQCAIQMGDTRLSKQIDVIYESSRLMGLIAECSVYEFENPSVDDLAPTEDKIESTKLLNSLRRSVMQNIQAEPQLINQEGHTVTHASVHFAMLDGCKMAALMTPLLSQVEMLLSVRRSRWTKLIQQIIEQLSKSSPA